MNKPSPITITRNGVTKQYGLDLVCSGYLISNTKVLLVRHKGFDKWVPPGGHIEAEETFAQVACREFLEETGLSVDAVSASELYFNDSNARTEPVPFHTDVLSEGFARPTLTQYFYVRLAPGASERIVPQQAEVHEVAWFSADDIDKLVTFEQVKVLARHVISHHPDSTRN